MPVFSILVFGIIGIEPNIDFGKSSSWLFTCKNDKIECINNVLKDNSLNWYLGMISEQSLGSQWWLIQCDLLKWLAYSRVYLVKTDITFVDWEM